MTWRLAQLLDEPQSLLVLEPGLEGYAEPQGTREEDQEVEPGVQRPEHVADRAELPPCVEVPGEIPKPHKGQADRQGGDRPDGQDGPASVPSSRTGRDRDLGQLLGEPGQAAPRQPSLNVIGEVLRRLDDLAGIQPMFRIGPGCNSNTSNTLGMLRLPSLSIRRSHAGAAVNSLRTRDRCRFSFGDGQPTGDLRSPPQLLMRLHEPQPFVDPVRHLGR